MVLGGLVDLGVPLERIREAIESLPLDGWIISSRKIESCGLACTKIDVKVGEHGHDRTWSDVESILRGGALAPDVLERSLAIFRRLFEAEAEVHGRTFEETHLHESGGIDAIVDVVGAVAGIAHLAPHEIVVSQMTTGFGEVACAHGVYPVPAPATALLVRGAPVRAGEIEIERLTPTGAAILTTLASRWGALPPMRPTAVGHGAGTRELKQVPNVLRMILGESERTAAGLAGIEGQVAVLECAVDDATPQALAFAAERLLEAGALEAFTSPITMKKGRQGHHLTVLGRPEDLTRLARRMLGETSTLGLRFRLEQRFELDRRIHPVETRYGTVRVKVGVLDGHALHAWPEYEDCAALAERHGVPLSDVQQAALEAHRNKPEGNGGTS